MKKVEFRLLQVILSPISGDRVTVALVHWDGTQLRVAASTHGLAAVDRSHREGIRAAIGDATRKAKRAAEQVASEPVLDLGLAQLLPVREGLGAALYWAPIVTMTTRNAEAHFEELKRDTRLDRARGPRHRRVTLRLMNEQLAALGESLMVGNSERVRTAVEVKFKTSFQSPLSWKNGKWHHVVPFSLDGVEESAIDREIQCLYGLVDLSFPKNQVVVVVAATPDGKHLKTRATTELAMLCTTLKSRHTIDLVFPERRGTWLGLEELETRVRRDIRTSH